MRGRHLRVPLGPMPDIGDAGGDVIPGFDVDGELAHGGLSLRRSVYPPPRYFLRSRR